MNTYTVCSQCHSINKIDISKIEKAEGQCGKCKTKIPFHGLVSETDENGLFKLIEKSDLPIVVDFWAPWCGPCRAFAPTFETASQNAKGKMVFIKVNTEQHQNISARLGIRGIPTLIIFKNGKEIARESGAFPLDYFQNWIGKFF